MQDYTVHMKKLIIFAGLIPLLTVCTIYDSLPEPELPKLSVVISSANYNSAANSIDINFQTSFDYDGIYTFYNKSSEFNMEYYIKNDLNIDQTFLKKSASSINGITVKLFPGQQKPGKLYLKNEEPFYFYRIEQWNYIIKAKACFTTADLSNELDILP